LEQRRRRPMSEEVMWEGSTLVLNDLEDILNKHLGEHFQWEWRSVVGEDSEENPIWSLTLYVESNVRDSLTQQTGEDQ
jgi:hypothetical protein